MLWGGNTYNVRMDGRMEYGVVKREGQDELMVNEGMLGMRDTRPAWTRHRVMNLVMTL
jgi:hypothetical protein